MLFEINCLSWMVFGGSTNQLILQNCVLKFEYEKYNLKNCFLFLFIFMFWIKFKDILKTKNNYMLQVPRQLLEIRQFHNI